MKDAQLRDVKCVVVPARKHPGCSGWGFVQRPPTGIELIEARLERAKTGLPQALGRGMTGPAGIVVDTPERPDEAVQDVAWRVHQILFDPGMSAIVLDHYS